MRIQFDKNVPYPLLRYLEKHDVRTAEDLKGRKLALIVLSTNRIGVLEKHPERLVAAVDAVRDGGYEFVRFELPPKRKPGATTPSN